MNSNGVYKLEQDSFILLSDSQWGTSLSSDKTEDNNKVHHFELLFLE